MKYNNLLLLFTLAFSANGFAQSGEPYIHDPSTIVECDGKLEMGPLTRFDMSFGANNNSVQGLVVNKTKWFNRLLQDPFFESEVKKRMNFYYEKKDDVINEIEANVQYLRFSAVENSKRWEVFEADSDYCIYYQSKNIYSQRNKMMSIKIS